MMARGEAHFLACLIVLERKTMDGKVRRHSKQDSSNRSRSNLCDAYSKEDTIDTKPFVSALF